MFRTDRVRIESPFGCLELTWSERGLRRIDLVGELPACDRARRNEPNFACFGIGPDTPLDLRGTPWQLRVWDALRAIPFGRTMTYGELARRLGQPGAARAVGAACGANPVAILVPCHRVVPAGGGLGGYRWGVERKARLLEYERRAVSPLGPVPRGTTGPVPGG